jgi:hypothetical protein
MGYYFSFSMVDMGIICQNYYSPAVKLILFSLVQLFSFLYSCRSRAFLPRGSTLYAIAYASRLCPWACIISLILFRPSVFPLPH